MNLSWKIFTAFGIPVRLHFSMIIIPFLAYSRMSGSGLDDLLIASLLVVLLFGSVLLHEFGHALTGRRYGVHTEDIVLTPIGGMARMQNIPQRPKEEILIAIAGPLVSFAIAVIFYGAALASKYSPLYAFGMQAIFVLMIQLNAALGVFNLIPALPMDGGRVFRGLLALKYSHLKATQIASKTGKWLAVGGGIWGAMNQHWMLVVIAFFIYSAAGQEMRIATMREAYKKAQQKGNPFGFSSAGGGGGGGRGFYVYKESGKPPADEWTDDTPHPRQAKVIESGKVEVISRKTPK